LWIIDVNHALRRVSTICITSMNGDSTHSVIVNMCRLYQEAGTTTEQSAPLMMVGNLCK
jgi:hypothetical protein